MNATNTDRLPNTVIRASAGSGKTFQLTNRYLSLLHRGVSPEKILAVTFTRKAAGEIFDRIVQRLADAAADESECRKLGGFIAAPELTTARCAELLVEVTRSLHRLRVGTLDSFFSKIAGSCSLELGLPLGWRIVEELADARLRDRAIADSLAGESVKPVLTLLHLLNKGDAARSVSQLIRETARQLYALGRETEAVVWKKLPRCPAVPAAELAAARQGLESISIPHKGIMKEVEKDREFLDNNKLEDFIRRGLASKLLDGATEYSKKPITDDVRQIYETLLRQVRHWLVNRLADQTEATYDLLLHYRQHYERLKHERAALRFEDVTFALTQWKSSPVADDQRVTFRLDAPIDHLLLDEFQDTSLAQWNVLRPIAQRVTSQDGGSFFCVGDTKQAIYGWRGGLAELFDAMQSELSSLQEVPLDTSFRSSQAVIDVVNRTFSRLDRHTELEDYADAVRKWQLRFREHQTSKPDLPGYVTLETSERIEIADDEGPEARELAEAAFLDFAARRIAQSYRESPGMTIGVLTRTNPKIGELIYRLRALGVPASEEGGNPLVDSCAVELILSLVRLADHPGDSAAAYHVACSPLGAAFDIQTDTIRRTAVLSARLRQELTDDGYGRAVFRWSQVLAPSCDSRDRSRLQQLVELSYSYQGDSTLRPADFLEFIERQKVSDPTSSAVRVMTVHQAKGLEFDIVFLPELDSGRTLLGQAPWVVTSRDRLGGDIDCVCRYANEHVQKLLPPSYRRMFAAAAETQIGEALCVMYVAMTRAIHALHLLIEPARENERGLPKTFAGLLRAALLDGPSTDVGLVYQHGEPNWYEQEKKRRRFTLDAPADAAAATPAKIVLAPPPRERRRGLERQSPSRLEGGSSARLRQALELIDPNRTAAMLRGTVIHNWFEQVLWLDDGVPSDVRLLEVLALIRGTETLPENMRRAWLKDFQAMLKQKEIATVLTRSAYCKSLPKGWSKTDLELEVRNEWPFAVIDGQQILSGRMDRVVFHRLNGHVVAADVLDFKTDALGSTPGERLDDRVEHYRPQMEAYRKTLMRQTGLSGSHVGAALLFVDGGIVVRS